MAATAGEVVTTVGSERSRGTSVNSDDPLALQTSDNPGMTLVTAPLTDSNYLTWNRLIRRALAAKKKIGFINGILPKLVQRWSMVFGEGQTR